MATRHPLDGDLPKTRSRERCDQLSHVPEGEVSAGEVVVGKRMPLVCSRDQAGEGPATRPQDPAQFGKCAAEAITVHVEVGMPGEDRRYRSGCERKPLEVAAHERTAVPGGECEHRCRRIEPDDRTGELPELPELSEVAAGPAAEIEDQPVADGGSEVRPERVSGKRATPLQPLARPRLVDRESANIHGSPR